MPLQIPSMADKLFCGLLHRFLSLRVFEFTKNTQMISLMGELKPQETMSSFSRNQSQQMPHKLHVSPLDPKPRSPITSESEAHSLVNG